MPKLSRTWFARLRDRFFRTKWLVVLVVTAVLLFFGRTTDIRSLTQSAIVIGLGIDRTETGFAVSTLSVIVSGSAGGDNSESYAVYSAEGATVSEGLDKIAQKMGLLVSLSHCNVLVLSEDAFSAEHTLLFKPLVTAYSLPEQAVVTATQSPPSDVLAARTGTTVASAYFVQASLLQNLGGDGLALVTVKDFLARSLSRSGCVNIPLIDIEEMPTQPGSEQGEAEGVAELFMNRNLVVSRDGCFVMDEDLAQALTMLTRSKVRGKLSVSLPGGGAAELRVINASPKLQAEGMSVKASLDVSVSFIEVQGAYTASDLMRETEKAAAAQLERRILACHALSLSTGADILGLENEVYKKAGYRLPENCLTDISFSCSVTVTVKESG